jgi:hypothetical protein
MTSTVTAFFEGRQIASGERDEVTRTLARDFARDESAILVFEDATGRVTDLDYRGVAKGAARGAGRPKLGVQAREVTLLPRHWEWLAGQPGGASAALRRLVEQARLGGGGERPRKDAAYRFMQAACGDRPGYEGALRALYRSDDAALDAILRGWPKDIRRYVEALLRPAPARGE